MVDCLLKEEDDNFYRVIVLQGHLNSLNTTTRLLFQVRQVSTTFLKLCVKNLLGESDISIFPSMGNRGRGFIVLCWQKYKVPLGVRIIGAINKAVMSIHT